MKITYLSQTAQLVAENNLICSNDFKEQLELTINDSLENGYSDDDIEIIYECAKRSNQTLKHLKFSSDDIIKCKVVANIDNNHKIEHLVYANIESKVYNNLDDFEFQYHQAINENLTKQQNLAIIDILAIKNL